MGKLSAMQIGGMALVLSSHQMEDLALLARRLTVFEKGRDVLAGPTGQVFDQVDALRENGLEPPAAAQVAQAMRQKGWPITPGITGLRDLERAIELLRGKLQPGGGHERI
jgi:ABC-type multidrug transport system ATPase subunit